MKKLLCTAALALSSFAVNAELLGITVGGYVWNAEVTEGKLSAPTFNNGAGYDISIDAKNANNGVFYIQWQHELAYIPNLKASINNIQHAGIGRLKSGTVDVSITDGEVDMSHYDFIASWPIIDSAVRWEAGVMVRVLDGITGGQNLVSDDGASTQYPVYIPLSTTMPLFYTSASLQLPLGFKTGVEIMGGDYDKQQVVDGNIYASYTSPFGLGFNAGYRILLTDIETQEETQGDDVFASMDFKGAYAGLYFNF